MVENLGLAMVKTTGEMKGLSQSIVIDSASVYDAAIKKISAPRILNEQGRQFADNVRSGGASTEDKLAFLGQATEGITSLYGSGGLGQAEIERQFGEGGAYFTEGPGKGLSDKTFTGDKVTAAAMTEQRNKARTGLGNLYGGQINALMADQGMGEAFDVTKFTEQLKGVSTDELARISAWVEGDATKGIAGMDMSGYKGTKTGSAAVAEMLGMDPALLGISAIGTDNEKTKALDTAALGISEASTELINQMADFFKRDKENTPEWFTKEAFEALIADTSTPRGGNIGDTTSSKLATTMGRHSAMDASLTGKRTVTSAYRTTGLGSVNSDHVTGRAYDLVGQNLGQYQTLAKAGGGFAEFHGTNAQRHLHVVPGPGIGDNSTPVASSNKQPSMAMSGGGGDTNYSFHIQGGKNASPQEIANLVIMKVKEIERSNRERS
jgi:hypothetical protein